MITTPSPRVLVLSLCVAIAPAAPSAAQTRGDFATPRTADIVAAPFADQEIARMLSLLDQRLAPPAPGAKPAVDAAALTLNAFVRRLQAGRLSRTQEEAVLARLEAIGRTRPELRAASDEARRLVGSFTVGKVAPDIVGPDLDGRPLRLRDYRGKIVVLTFSGEWCGICRSEYPYHRLLLDLYSNWPFALLSVETGTDPVTAKRAQHDARLPHPSWWDVDDSARRAGRIATAWGVTGFPTVYVLDGEGVIRFVDLRKEDLLRAVRQLMTELLDAQDSRATPARRSK